MAESIQGIKVSALPEATQTQLTDTSVTIIDDGTTTRKTKLSTFVEWLKGKIIKNTLTQASTGYALDAYQGKLLKDEVDELNSAMKIDLGTTETPTHELYEGKRIYTKYIDCVDLPNSGDKIYQLDIPGTFFWVDWGNSYIYSNAESFRRTMYPLNYANPKTGKGITYALDRYDKNIVFRTNENWQGYNAFIVVKYYY